MIDSIESEDHEAKTESQPFENSRSLLIAEFMSQKGSESKTNNTARIADETNWRWPMPQGLLPTPLDLKLSKEEKERIGNKVWNNESGGSIDGLTAWNKGEDFPSLGIGHFIWMPKGVKTPFGESFPEAMQYVQSEGAQPPSWLRIDKPCPWNSRTEFLRDFKGKQLSELREFLAQTVPEQTDYIISRLEKALPKILDHEDPSQVEQIKKRFYRVLNSGPAGVFALIDYTNFKGEGLEPVPQYNNHSWGLKQVLEGMNDGDDPVRDFSESAKEVLRIRVANSPASRNEKQWLQGWLNRVDRYVSDPPFMANH